MADKVEGGKEIAVYGKWEQTKQQLMGMKVVAQVDDGLEPVYHLTAGMKQSQLVKVIHQVFESGLLSELPENLPEFLIEKYRLRSEEHTSELQSR